VNDRILEVNDRLLQSLNRDAIMRLEKDKLIMPEAEILLLSVLKYPGTHFITRRIRDNMQIINWQRFINAQ